MVEPFTVRLIEAFKRAPTLIKLTTIVLTIYLGTFFLLCWLPFPPFSLVALVTFTALGLVGLAFVNLSFAVFTRTQKLSHAAMGLVVVIAVVGAFSLVSWINPVDLWFYRRGGHQKLHSMVDKVLQRNEVLSSKLVSLDHIAGHHDVYGKTNADGSFMVLFHLPSGRQTHGYLYYSGNQMRPKPDQTNRFYLEEIPFRSCRYLTNGWYIW